MELGIPNCQIGGLSKVSTLGMLGMALPMGQNEAYIRQKLI
jgi:hypothetical protein